MYNLLSNLTTQISKYSYKIILFNDGSSDQRYKKLQKIFNIFYIQNNKNNGKCLYWKTITNIFNQVKKYNFEYLLQIDDDFDICENFINKLIDEHKKQNDDIIATMYSRNIEEKRWGYYDFVDGGFICNKKLLELLDYKIPERKCSKNLGSGVWKYVSSIINKNKLKVHLHPRILISHLGYKDSKMNTKVRINNNIIIDKSKEEH